jgi:hypothetical protein
VQNRYFKPREKIGRGLKIILNMRNALRFVARAARPGRSCPWWRSSWLATGDGLVDEDEPLGAEIELPLEALLATLQDVGALLFGGMCGLFSA